MPADPTLDLEELAALTRSAASETGQTVAEQFTRDQSRFARLIVIGYISGVGLVVCFMAIGMRASPDVWDKTADKLVDLVKTCMLPIVTLVLGYYFGRPGGKG